MIYTHLQARLRPEIGGPMETQDQLLVKALLLLLPVAGDLILGWLKNDKIRYKGLILTVFAGLGKLADKAKER